MKHLYFCRHGESELNTRRIYAGQIDTPLTDKGRAQAQAAGKQAAAIRFDLIVSSPLSRALETAQIIAREIGYPLGQVVVNDMFKERSLGSLQGKPWDQFTEADSLFPDVESEAALLVRAQQGLAYLQDLEADTVLLVGHGSFYRKLRTAIDPTQDYPEPPNAQIVELFR